MSKEFLDLKLAPLRPLDHPWPSNYGCACILASTPSLVDFLLPRNVCPVKGPRGGICNLARRFLGVTSRTLNLSCALVFKHVLVSLWAIALAGISRSKTSICPSCRFSVVSSTTKSNPSLKKTHFALQCPRPLRATMTTSNKVATLPNPKLTMQQPLPNFLTHSGAV